MANTVSTPAPWRAQLISHIKELDEPSFTLSTLHSTRDSSGQVRYTPRCRTVIYRGMWADLPVNPKNPAELNRDVYESDLPTITSDARMDKIPELFRSKPSSSSLDDGPEEPQSSGQGGPVEAVFWIKKVNTQWRIRGNSYVVGPDIDSPSAKPVREALAEHMRRRDPSKDSSSSPTSGDDFDWGKELTAHFGNMSPGMRGSFRNPPPGRPLSEKPGEGLKLGQKVEDVHDEIARSNFRVVIIVPEEVESVDLTDPSEAKRWKYTFTGSGQMGSWKATECWP